MPNRKSGKGGMGGKLLTKGDRDPYKNETTVGGWKDESRFLSYMLSVRLRTEGWTSFAKHLFLFLCTASYEGLIQFIRQIGLSNLFRRPVAHFSQGESFATAR